MDRTVVPARPRRVLALALLIVVAPLAGASEAQNPEAEVRVSEAVVAYEDAKYDAALQLLREALALDPGHVEAHYYLGLVYLARRQPALAAESLERARALAPEDLAVLFQLGIAYFAQEDYDRAEPLLSRVFAAQPRVDGLGYYVGFMRYRKKDYHGALRAFSAGTTRDPSIEQLTRLYTGLALATLGLPERAATEVDAALRVQPGSPVTGPAERIRDTLLARRETEQRLRAEVRIGLLYDDNVATNPTPKDDPTVSELRHRKTRSEGGLAALRLEYVWFRSEAWEATAGYSFLQTYNDLTSFNVRDHLGSVGASHRGTLGLMPFQAGAQVAYDHLSLREERFLQRSSGTLFGTLVEDATHLTSVQLRVQGKDFAIDRTTPREDRQDAMNYLAGFVHLLRFASDRHLIRAGYQIDREIAEGSNFSYLGHRVLLGGQYTLPWGETRLRYDFDIHHRDYDHRHSSLPSGREGTRRRDDTEQTHVVRVEQPLPHNLTLTAELQAIRARSNLAIFSFDRNVFSLQLSWQY